MSEITIRTLAEDEWEQYRDMRLRALRESPDAFVADVETEEQYDEQLWRDRGRGLRCDRGNPAGLAVR